MQGEDFKTFVSVYSAIVGGGLTLLGVAWTIRKGDEDRKKDREQLEQDRKKEEINKAKPFFTYRLEDKYLKKLSKSNGFCYFPTVNSNNVHFQARIINSNKCSIKLSRILIDNKWYKSRGVSLLLERDECIIFFNLDEKVINKTTKNQTNKNICYVVLEILDMYDNPYYYCLTYNKFDNQGEVYYSLLECEEIKQPKQEKTNE